MGGDDPPQACSLAPDAGEVDYFPLTVGDVWVFDYEYTSRDAMPSTTRRTGTLTWTVESMDECDQDRQPYTITETLETTTTVRLNGELFSEDSSSRSKRLDREAFGDSVFVPYSDEPVLRFGPSTGPDTLEYSDFNPLCVGQCVSGTTYTRNFMDVVQGRGIVSRYFLTSIRGGEAEETITRRADAE